MNKKKSVAGALLVTKDQELLLQHRDDKPNIPAPNQWALFGGGIEAGEDTETAMLREIEEEITFMPKNYSYFCHFWGDILEYHIYLVELDVGLDELVQHEGQDMALFTVEDALAKDDLTDSARLAIEIYQRYLVYWKRESRVAFPEFSENKLN